MTAAMQGVGWATAAEVQRAAELAVARCRELSCITDEAGGTTRTFLSEGMRRANNTVAGWMRAAGMTVRVDAAGNLRGVLGGSGAPFVIASHLDTIPNAGAFDGTLGVMLGIAVAELCGEVLPFPLEVIGFSEEEGVRFGAPFIGSRAFMGTLDEELLNRRDHDGVSVRQAIAQYGLHMEVLPQVRDAQAFGYLEFHIEQGPVLESENLPLGIVETIAGQSRYAVTFTGTANHAGTTPMHLRQDAVCAAAAWTVEVERYARQTAGVVATVGSVKVWPGAGNVVPGQAVCSLDVRSAEDSLRGLAVRHLLDAAAREGSVRTVTVACEAVLNQAAVPMDAGLLRRMEVAVTAAGYPVRHMVSGAGHDAMIVAPQLAAAMLFVRTPHGLSHHPDEAVRTEDVAAALATGVHLMRGLAATESAR